MIDVGPYIRQGAEPHGAMLLGRGKRNHAQAGCLLSCLQMASVALANGTAPKSILEAGRRILEADGFMGSSLVMDRACPVLGIKCSYVGHYDSGIARGTVWHGKPVILGLDYKPGSSSGVSDADHFVLAIGTAGDDWTVVDPASGCKIAIPRTGVFAYRGGDAEIVEMRLLVAVPH